MKKRLRLNRRLAPEIYLEVVSICGEESSPQLGNDEAPIEYAVKMRQFSQEVLLSQLIKQDGLTTRHLDQLADDVAAFHSSIPVAGASVQYGDLECVNQPVRENFRHLTKAPVSNEVERQLKYLDNWSQGEFERLQAVFVARKKSGFIRECHGDMHLGNMILDDGRVTIFDCIEFNESFRWIDVLSELAFLVMDLGDRGRPDYGQRGLNRYLEQTGDYEGLAVLPFYLVYRALVRAKVTLLRMLQGHLDSDERATLMGEFEAYLNLAERETYHRKPSLTITHGLSGSGKSTGTQAVIESSKSVRIRSDIERKRFYGLASGDVSAVHVEKNLYAPETTEATYQRLAQLASSILNAGLPVIVDATFLDRGQRTRFNRLAKRENVPFRIIHFRASEETLRQRVLSRSTKGDDASDAGIDVLAHQLHSYEPLQTDERTNTIEIDTEQADWIDRLIESMAAQ